MSDINVGKVYAHSPGHNGIIEPVVPLSADLFCVIRVGDQYEVSVSSGKHHRVEGTSRGVLAVSAPSEVWEAARAGQDVNSLPAVDKVYSQNLIIIDNLPPQGAPSVDFDHSEFASVRVVAPTHLKGPFAEFVPRHDQVVKGRQSKYSQQAAEEERKRQLFAELQTQLGQHGLTRTSLLRQTQEVRMPLDEFILLAELALKREKR
jgi:hypothetical protein